MTWRSATTATSCFLLPRAASAISPASRRAVRKCGAISVLPTAMRCCASCCSMPTSCMCCTRLWNKMMPPSSKRFSARRAKCAAPGLNNNYLSFSVMSQQEFLELPPLMSARGAVRLPGSKSISNRVLLLAALAEGVTDVCDLLHSDDTERMLEALRTLGVKVEALGDNAYRVAGCGGNV